MANSTFGLKVSTEIRTFENITADLTCPDSDDPLREKLLQNLNDDAIQKLTPVFVFLSLLAFIGLLGNGVVFHIYRTRIQISNSQFFIMCLSALDLFSCCFVIPFEAYTLSQEFAFRRMAICKLSAFLNAVSTLSPTFLLFAIAIERYRKICTPFKRQFSKKATRVMTVMAAVFGVLLSWPLLVLYSVRTLPSKRYEICIRECSMFDDHNQDGGTVYPTIYISVFVVLFVIGMCFITTIYVLIGKQIKSQIQNRNYDSSKQEHSSSMMTGDFDNVKETNSDDRTSQIKEKTDENGESIRLITFKTEVDVLHSAGKRKDKSDIDGAKPEENFKFEAMDEVPAKKMNYPRYSPVEDTAIDEDIQICTTNDSVYLENSIRTNQQQIDETKQEDHENKPTNVETRRLKRIKTRMSSKFLSFTSRISNVAHQVTVRISDHIDSDGNYHRAKSRKTTFLMFLVSLTFIVSYLPYLVLMIYRIASSNLFDEMSESEVVVYEFFLRSYFLNCSVNPFIYGVFDFRFRRACSRVIRNLKHKCSGCFG